MELNLNNSVIIYNPEIEGSYEFSKVLSKKLENLQIYTLDNMPKDPEFVIVVGGDGTLLKCARNYCESDTPIFGFNMGRLGFLAQALPSEIDTVVNKIKSGNFRVEKRIMLRCHTTGAVALNDMVIRGATFSRTSTLNLYINNVKLCSYLADGLIISTPTGSSAYALSAGGPIIAPSIECFVVVPICPHTLNARPIVIPSDEHIKITTLEAPKDFQITADGQDARIIKNEICVEKHTKYAKLLLLNDNKNHFYDILREKLHWGMAPNK